MKEKSLMNVLHDVQDGSTQNCIPPELALKVAETFKVAPSEVYGVVTFYTMFFCKTKRKTYY